MYFGMMNNVVITAWRIIFFILAPAMAECDGQIRRPDRHQRCIDEASMDHRSNVPTVFRIRDDAERVSHSVGTMFPRQGLSILATNATTDAAHDANLAVIDNDVPKNRDRKIHTPLSRRKRTLTFPPPATILVTFGLGTPLQLDRESVILGAFAKFISVMPSNSTDFTEPEAHYSRKKTRWTIYKALERAAELYGFGAGKGCLLRAVCEVAATPFDLRHGLFGQMVQAFLTPSSTSEPYDEYTDREYHAAESLGKHVGENCHALYPECRRSVLDVFSTTAEIVGKPTITATTTRTTTTTTTTTTSLGG